MNIDKKLRHLGVVFLVVLISLLAFDIFRRGIFSSKIGFNIVVIGERSVSLLLLRPDEEIVSWIELPENLKVKIYNSTASYPAVSLWKYGISEKKPFEIVEKSLGLAMGAAISKTIKVDGEVSVAEVLASIHKLGLKTDLSFKDRFLVRQFLAETVTSKKVLELTMPKSAFEIVVEPDGKEFLTFNSIANLWIKNKFVLEPVLSENVDISVNNITGQSGMGTQVSKQLESAGLRVVEVKADMNDNVTEKGCVFTTKGSFPMTERFLVTQMGCVEGSSPVGEESGSGIRLWLK